MERSIQQERKGPAQEIDTSYKLDFYAAYDTYLQEPRVRRVHDEMLRVAGLDPALSNVVDMGCGQGNEFLKYAAPRSYVGLDKNAIPRSSGSTLIKVADYRDTDVVVKAIADHHLTGVVSLFSAECTAPARQNYALYQELFARTNIKTILTSGFYYVHAKGQETIGEAGGIVSYQTIDAVEDHVHPLFTETRMITPCPSSLFGEDVVEVWKILRQNTGQ